MFCFQRAVPAVQCSRLQAPWLQQRDGSEFSSGPPGTRLGILDVGITVGVWQCAWIPREERRTPRRALAVLLVAAPSPGINRSHSCGRGVPVNKSVMSALLPWMRLLFGEDFISMAKAELLQREDLAEALGVLRVHDHRCRDTSPSDGRGARLE